MTIEAMSAGISESKGTTVHVSTQHQYVIEQTMTSFL